MEGRSLIVITKGSRVVVPPELYVSSVLAKSEAARWLAMIGAVEVGDAGGVTEKGLAAASPPQTVVHILSLTEADISATGSPEASWIGVQSTRASLARISVRAVLADALEAAEWFRRRAPKKTVVAANPEFRWEALIERRGAETYVGAHRLKHVGVPEVATRPI